MMAASAFILSSRFCPLLTGRTVVACAGKEYVLSTAEMTLSLQVDLVLSDAAATREP